MMPWSGGREAGEEATYSSLFRRERVAAWSGEVEAEGGGGGNRARVRVYVGGRGSKMCP